MYNKKPHMAIIILPLIIVITIICIFTPFLKVVSSWCGNVITPVQSGITSAVVSVQGVFDGFKNTQKLVQENKALQSKIDELIKENKENFLYKTENERLKNLLNLKDELNQLKPVAASVIAKDAGNWFNVFTVNKGKDALVEENTPVVSEKGLIGRVSQVGANWSKVVTVIDYDHSVSGIISRTGDLVQIDGDLTLMKSGLCKMTIITEGADVIIGDTVVTSGIGGIYPKGLFLGTVIEFRNNSDGTGKYAVVKPDVDFQHIFDVLLLTKAGE